MFAFFSFARCYFPRQQKILSPDLQIRDHSENKEKLILKRHLFFHQVLSAFFAKHVCGFTYFFLPCFALLASCFALQARSKQTKQGKKTQLQSKKPAKQRVKKISNLTLIVKSTFEGLLENNPFLFFAGTFSFCRLPAEIRKTRASFSTFIVFSYFVLCKQSKKQALPCKTRYATCYALCDAPCYATCYTCFLFLACKAKRKRQKKQAKQEAKTSKANQVRQLSKQTRTSEMPYFMLALQEGANAKSKPKTSKVIFAKVLQNKTKHSNRNAKSTEIYKRKRPVFSLSNSLLLLANCKSESEKQDLQNKEKRESLEFLLPKQQSCSYKTLLSAFASFALQSKQEAKQKAVLRKQSKAKEARSKCHAINAINSCFYMGPSPSTFNPYSIWAPSMYDFLQGCRENHAVFAYEKTAQKFLESLHLCALIRRRGGSIYVIFDQDGGASIDEPLIGTFFDSFAGFGDFDGFSDFQARQTKELRSIGFEKQSNTKSSKSFAIPYETVKKTDASYQHSIKFPGYETPYGWSSEKWVGGTFSNFQQVSKSVSLYGTLSRQFFNFLQQNKNVSSRYRAMHIQFRGNVLSQTADSFKSLKSSLHQYKGKNPINLCFKKNPQVILVENANKNRNVIKEAHALNIPIISFADSDVAEAVLSKVSLVIGLNIYKRSFFYNLLHYIYKIPVYK